MSASMAGRVLKGAAAATIVSITMGAATLATSEAAQARPSYEDPHHRFGGFHPRFGHDGYGFHRFGYGFRHRGFAYRPFFHRPFAYRHGFRPLRFVRGPFVGDRHRIHGFCAPAWHHRFAY